MTKSGVEEEYVGLQGVIFVLLNNKGKRIRRYVKIMIKEEATKTNNANINESGVDVIISHLGKNPIKGGRPPKDIRVVVRLLNLTKLKEDCLRWWIEEVLLSFKTRRTHTIITEYRVKYRAHAVSWYSMLSSIQDMWEIEEYANSLRKEDWLIAPRHLTTADRVKIAIRGGLLIEDSIYMGIIFCHVLKSVKLIQVRPSLTWGNQKNKGNSPSFLHKASIVNLSVKYSHITFCPISIEKINRELAKVWTMKYFIELLIERLSLLNMRGINTIMFTSNDTHSWNHVSLDRAKIDENPRIKINKYFILVVIYKGY